MVDKNGCNLNLFIGIFTMVIDRHKSDIIANKYDGNSKQVFISRRKFMPEMHLG